MDRVMWDGNLDGWYALTDMLFKIEDGSAYYVTNLRADYNWGTHEFEVSPIEKYMGTIPKEAYDFTKKSYFINFIMT